MSKSVQRWTETDKEIIRHNPAPIINESLARDDSSSDPLTEQEGKGKAAGRDVRTSPGIFDISIRQIIGNPMQCEHETATPQINSVAGEPIRVIV